MEFVQLGEITAAGQKVIDYIESHKGKDVGEFNQLPGHVKHYLLNVTEAQVLKPVDWLRDYPYAAGSVWDMLEEQRRQDEVAATAQEASTRSTEVAEQVAALEQKLADAMAKIGELTEAAKPKKNRKPTPAVSEEAEDEADEPEA